MKKSLISILLSLVLLLGLCALSVSAAEETGHVHCVCGGNLTEEAKTASGHVCDSAAITWEAWGDEAAEKDSLPKSGNYYLVADMTLSSTSSTGPCDVKENTVLNLCLNGHSITTKGRTFDLYGTLNLSDCQGTGVVTGNVENKTSGSGGVVILRAKAGAQQTLNLYGGTLQQAAENNNTTGVIHMLDGTAANHATVNMYGGTVTGGKASGNGGNVYVGKYTIFNMYGGTVTGGNAGSRGGNFAVLDYATLNIAGGTVTGGQATDQGGNIRGMGNSIVKLSGGTVSNGTATTDGGNIFFAGATLELTGGTITGGQAVNGGNLYRATAVTLGAVTISDGTATKDGGNIYAAEITVEGASISGGQAVNGGSIRAGGTFLMTSGSISGGVATGNGGNIYGLRSVKIHGGTVEKGSAVLGGNIYTMRYTTTTGTNLVYVEAFGGNILNGTASQEGGNIYTDGQFTMKEGQLSGGQAVNGGNLFMIKCGDALAICNISGGTISSGQASQGGNMYLMGAKANLTGGTISGGQATTNGGNIALAGSSELTLNSVTVSGGHANGGGNLFVGVATVTIKDDAVVENGWSNLRGGNIRIDNVKSVVNIEGGQILNGGKNAEGKAVTTYGGNIDVYNGKLNISDGTIADGAAITMGGNIAVENTAVLSITGGGINGGDAPNGGSIAVVSTAANAATIENASISGGNAVTNGGNILVDNGAVVTLIGGTVTGGTANGGANIHVETGTLSIDGTTVENGTANARGGNIRINSSGIGSIKNATISGGSATYGGNLCVFLGGQTTVENTTISGGTATTNGGSISVERTAKLTMTDCTVSGGDVPTTSDEMGFGGSIFVDNTASLSITGGSIQGGNSRFGGALAACSTGTVTVNGTAITSGAGNNGTAIYVAPGCGLTLTDTTVTGSGAGTTIWNRGIITLAGTFDMPKMEFDLMIDCRYGESYIDIKDLTAIGEDPISLRRWAIDSTDDDMGLLAVGATEEQLAMFEARKNDNYKIVYENGTLVLTSAHNVQTLDATGKLVGGYATLTEAMADSGVQYVLYATLDAQTISKSILLDLNGNNLTNVTVNEGVTIQLIDSVTDDFAGVYGRLSGTVSGTVETFVTHGGKTYLAVCENGEYSAHRYDVKLTHVSLDPAKDALGYKAQLLGDEVVCRYVTGFGFNLWVNEGVVKTYTKAFDGNKVLTLRLQNILASGGGEMAINGNAFVTFSLENKTVTSADYSTTMRKVIETVNASFDGYTDAQKEAVQALVVQHEAAMTDWSIDKIKQWAPVTEETPAV